MSRRPYRHASITGARYVRLSFMRPAAAPTTAKEITAARSPTRTKQFGSLRYLLTLTTTGQADKANPTKPSRRSQERPQQSDHSLRSGTETRIRSRQHVRASSACRRCRQSGATRTRRPNERLRQCCAACRSRPYRTQIRNGQPVVSSTSDVERRRADVRRGGSTKGAMCVA